MPGPAPGRHCLSGSGKLILTMRGHVLPLYGFRSGTARRLKCLEAAVAWIALIVAGFFEIAWAVAMKQSDGFTRLWPTMTTFIAITLSVIFLSVSMRTLPLGTAYTIWTGIGAVGAFAVSVLFLGEAAGAQRLVAAVLILSGIVLMNLSSSS